MEDIRACASMSWGCRFIEASIAGVVGFERVRHQQARRNFIGRMQLCTPEMSVGAHSASGMQLIGKRAGLDKQLLA